MVWLFTDRGEYREIPSNGKVSIGRAAGSDIQLDSQSVSKNHAEISTSTVDGQTVSHLVDFSSRNGTLVGQSLFEIARVNGKVKLLDGDYIRFGNYPKMFRYHVNLPTAPAASAAAPLPPPYSAKDSGAIQSPRQSKEFGAQDPLLLGFPPVSDMRSPIKPSLSSSLDISAKLNHPSLNLIRKSTVFREPSSPKIVFYVNRILGKPDTGANRGSPSKMRYTDDFDWEDISNFAKDSATEAFGRKNNRDSVRDDYYEASNILTDSDLNQTPSLPIPDDIANIVQNLLGKSDPLIIDTLGGVITRLNDLYKKLAFSTSVGLDSFDSQDAIDRELIGFIVSIIGDCMADVDSIIGSQLVHLLTEGTKSGFSNSVGLILLISRECLERLKDFYANPNSKLQFSEINEIVSLATAEILSYLDAANLFLFNIFKGVSSRKGKTNISSELENLRSLRASREHAISEAGLGVKPSASPRMSASLSSMRISYDMLTRVKSQEFNSELYKTKLSRLLEIFSSLNKAKSYRRFYQWRYLSSAKKKLVRTLEIADRSNTICLQAAFAKLHSRTIEINKQRQYVKEQAMSKNTHRFLLLSSFLKWRYQSNAIRLQEKHSAEILKLKMKNMELESEVDQLKGSNATAAALAAEKALNRELYAKLVELRKSLHSDSDKDSAGSDELLLKYKRECSFLKDEIKKILGNPLSYSTAANGAAGGIPPPPAQLELQLNSEKPERSVSHGGDLSKSHALKIISLEVRRLNQSLFENHQNYLSVSEKFKLASERIIDLELAVQGLEHKLSQQIMKEKSLLSMVREQFGADLASSSSSNERVGQLPL